MSGVHAILAHMFDIAEFAADADEAALVARIDELETLKAAAAAAQARATAAHTVASDVRIRPLIRHARRTWYSRCARQAMSRVREVAFSWAKCRTGSRKR